MRRLSLLGAVGAAALALVPSCNALFPFYPDQACESFIRALCHFQFSCCDANERARFFPGGGLFGGSSFKDEQDCVDQQLKNGGECQNGSEVQEAVSQGRFSYDAALAEKCMKPQLDALNNCDSNNVPEIGGATPKVPDTCTGVDGLAFGTGKVKDGKPCFQPFECIDPGSLCVQEPQDPTADPQIVTAVGKCKSPAKEGGDCSDTGSQGLCEPGTQCNNGICEKQTLLGNGQDCFVDQQCQSAFCNDLNIGAQPTCDNKLDLGAACGPGDDADCASGFCKNDPAANTDTCAQPIKTQVDACNGLQGDDTSFKN